MKTKKMINKIFANITKEDGDLSCSNVFLNSLYLFRSSGELGAFK